MNLSDQASELRKTAADCLSKAEELEAKIKADNGPVTVVVGDEVYHNGHSVGAIVSPQFDASFFVVRTPSNLMFHDLDSRDLTTPDGRKIDRIVPFRIMRTDKGRWTYQGDYSRTGFGYRVNAQQSATALARALWPWYEGPAYVVEKN